MHKISGVLNVFFPFELRDTSTMRHFNGMHNRIRDRQIKKTRLLHQPRTDLMDSREMRGQVESALSEAQKLMGGIWDSGSEPYATQSLAKLYHKEREENFFVKEPSVIISQFTAVCPGVNAIDEPMKGRLYYFNNLANHVGTYLVSLKIENRGIDEILRLKHAFYKRAQIYIKETALKNVECDTPMEGWLTFQEYICLRAKNQKYRRKTDIDSRARYSLLEIKDDGFSDKELYALLTSNEKYYSLKSEKDVTNKKDKHICLCDYSKEITYSMYFNLRNGLIVNHNPYNSVFNRQKVFFGKLQFAPKLIDVEVLGVDDWIAGYSNGKFPYFIKAVELHLLTNNVQRHETVRHRISYLIPWILIRRRIKIWKILYDMDIYHCFINNDMLKEFGVSNNLDIIKEEFEQLRNHISNYIMIAVAIIALFIAIISK